MSAIPGWPAADGPRILTLVGNDLTIDVRARKTASSLARAGFSVISLGVDPAGTSNPIEDLDGALLYRVSPSIDPRISPRLFRFSRPELRDSFRYRTEIQRQRLYVRRRNLTAWRHLRLRDIATQRAESGETPEGEQLSIRGFGSKLRRRSVSVKFHLQHRMKRLRVNSTQLRFKTTNGMYKALARPPKRTLRRGSWRRDLPELHRYESALGSIVDHLAPDLIHVHDIFHLGLAARAAARSAERDQHIAVIYDAHEFVPGLPVDPRRRKAYTNLEEEYFSRADAVITVSEALADEIEARYGRRPSVVMNTPDLDTIVPTRPLKAIVGLPDEAKMVVYVGGVAPSRGAEELIEAIAQLPLDVHGVFVAGPATGYVSQLRTKIADAGLSDRVHFAPFVAPEAVVSYIQSADVSVIPLSRAIANFEVALPNKLFQSIHAGLPVAVSDNPAMSQFVTKYGIGEVFEAGKPEAMAKAIQTILDHPSGYREALEDQILLEFTTWRTQVGNLIDIYRSLGFET